MNYEKIGDLMSNKKNRELNVEQHRHDERVVQYIKKKTALNKLMFLATTRKVKLFNR